MKAIVTTTINPPTLALRKFAALPGWQLYVVGDLATPHQLYEAMPGVRYLSPHYQADRYSALSETIGWNCIQRRNIGFAEAYNDGAEIVATVDDDNIPYDGWGSNLLVGRKVHINCYEHVDDAFFDPLAVTNARHLWHRGFPLADLPRRFRLRHRTCQATILVQADLWDGDPDCDAMARIAFQPLVRLAGPFPYTTTSLTVFNSQNTFLDRSCFPDYCCVAHADRMDDIWGSLLLQVARRTDLPCIAFHQPSVYQARNPHSALGDLAREIRGHDKTLDIAHDWQSALSDSSLAFIAAYRAAFHTTEGHIP